MNGWRFNAMTMAKRVGEGTHGLKQGDQVFAELAAGNRFWLEPYPGPFMRADVLLRFRHESADRQGGRALPDTGGDLLTAGLTWAFRPRPSLDFQGGDLQSASAGRVFLDEVGRTGHGFCRKPLFNRLACEMEELSGFNGRVPNR